MDSRTGLKVELLPKEQGYRLVSLKLGSMSKRLPHWRNGLYARIMRTNNLRGCRPKKALADKVARHIVEKTVEVPGDISTLVTQKHTLRKASGICLITYGYKGHRPARGEPRIIDRRKLKKSEITLLIKAIQELACDGVDAVLSEIAKKKALKYLGA